MHPQEGGREGSRVICEPLLRGQPVTVFYREQQAADRGLEVNPPARVHYLAHGLAQESRPGRGQDRGGWGSGPAPQSTRGECQQGICVCTWEAEACTPAWQCSDVWQACALAWLCSYVWHCSAIIRLCLPVSLRKSDFLRFQNPDSNSL